jgi:hypothetical protein
MPHLRNRAAVAPLLRLSKLWPVIGLAGLRQVGKSTLIRDLLKISNFVTLDDDDVKTDAQNAPKVFLAKYPRPLVIDEIQKVPKLFDAIKSEVDRKRIPATFFITGSQSFSAGDLSRESLTGRIGTLKLYPLTLRESLGSKATLGIDLFVKGMIRGGLPVPMFLRDDESRRLYWDGWLETTLIRDLSRAYGKGYDLDFARLILKELSEQLASGRYVTVSQFSKDSRKVTKYLRAMESNFMLNRLPCHEKGVGLDHWLMGDSGLAAHLMGQRYHTEEATLTLARHSIYNEIAAGREYQLRKNSITYFKSARGEPIDFVVDETPIKVITKSSGALGWEEKGLVGAMKKLGSPMGLLTAPIEKSDAVKETGISRVSWLHFC